MACLPNFIKISQAITTPGYVEENYKHTHIQWNRKNKNKDCLAVPAPLTGLVAYSY